MQGDGGEKHSIAVAWIPDSFIRGTWLFCMTLGAAPLVALLGNTADFLDRSQLFRHLLKEHELLWCPRVGRHLLPHSHNKVEFLRFHL